MIRQAVPSDAVSIASLLVRSIRELCGPDYDRDEDLLAHWCQNKTPENVQRWMSNDANHFVVSEQNGEIAGVGLITNEGKILLCYLLPKFQGKGVGKEILTALFDHAVITGLNRVSLESTRTARAFYLHHGFIEIGETACQGKIPGFIMERHFNVA